MSDFNEPRPNEEFDFLDELYPASPRTSALNREINPLKVEYE